MPEDNSDLVIPFGKHRGKLICDLDSGYLKWLATNCDWNDEVCAAADAEYNFREQYRTHIWEDD